MDGACGMQLQIQRDEAADVLCWKLQIPGQLERDRPSILFALTLHKGTGLISQTRSVGAGLLSWAGRRRLYCLPAPGQGLAVTGCRVRLQGWDELEQRRSSCASPASDTGMTHGLSRHLSLPPHCLCSATEQQFAPDQTACSNISCTVSIAQSDP